MTPKHKVLLKFPKAHAYQHGYRHYVTQTKESGIVLGTANSRKLAWELASRSAAVTGVLDRSDDYVPADIIAGDHALATHCETYLCTECSMPREHRMARITQSIADYREHHVTRARRGQRPE